MIQTTYSTHTIGIINIVFMSRLVNISKTFFVFFGKAVGGALGGRGFEVVHAAGFLLVFLEDVAHVVERFHREAFAGFGGGHAAGCPVQQTDAQARLQAAQGVAQRGGRNPQFGGGLSEVARSGHGDEAVQIVEAGVFGESHC